MNQDFIKKWFWYQIRKSYFLNHDRKFEDLTLVPFENSMIIKSMLNKSEKNGLITIMITCMKKSINF